jgi:endonuclease-3
MKNRTKILSILEETYKNTKTALDYNSDFQLLIATMLAAQSTDVRVNIVTKGFFKNHPTAADMAALSVAEIENYIKTVGLYKTKAQNVKKCSGIIDEKYKGEIPETREALMELPGVGRKTANVVLSIAKNIPAIAVDTHVFRVSNRLGLAEANNVLDTEKQLMKNIPKKNWSDAHHWIIWHGRKVCKARNPLCEECNLLQYCRYGLKK